MFNQRLRGFMSTSTRHGLFNINSLTRRLTKRAKRR